MESPKTPKVASLAARFQSKVESPSQPKSPTRRPLRQNTITPPTKKESQRAERKQSLGPEPVEHKVDVGRKPSSELDSSPRVSVSEESIPRNYSKEYPVAEEEIPLATSLEDARSIPSHAETNKAPSAVSNYEGKVTPNISSTERNSLAYDTLPALSEETISLDIPLSLPTDVPPAEEPPLSAGLAGSSIYDLMSPPVNPSSLPLVSKARESIAASEFNDIDESRFSTVALNIGDKRDSGDTSKTHKRNSSNASFLLQRSQDPQFQKSSDGQQILQEEFNRVHEKDGDQDENENVGAVDWDFWGAVMADYQAYASEHAEQLARAIELGIPDALRGMVWQLMSASKDPELEKKYLALLKETSIHEKAIMRDLGRTFPHHAFFTDGQGIGQENLFNVLKAYSLYDPQVGYCQGLPFVVAILLLNMPDEEAFCLLVRLMESYDLRGHFLPDMPKLQLRLFQFDRLVEELLPVLHVHFLRQGVKSSMFCSHWFLTLFSYRFPHDIVFRIFDNCLASGVEAIFGFSLVLLRKNEDKLLSLKFDQILIFLNTQVFETYQGEPGGRKYKADQFVQDAAAIKITPFMLDSYAHEYSEMLKIRDAHILEIEALKNSNRNLYTQVQNMEASLTQLNDEHREVLNQLDQSRQKTDELESELVRYKLLYAEAMHRNEDALSSHRVSMRSNSNRGSASTGMGS